MRRLAGVLAAYAVLTGTVALADGSSKPLGGGGRFAVYLPIIAKFNKSGERFRVEGVCRSACTLFLSIRNVCLERDAQVSFHAGPDRITGQWTARSSSTKTMLAAYKPALRKYLLDGHHVDSPNYHTLSGAMLVDRFGYRACPAATPPLPVKAPPGRSG